MKRLPNLILAVLLAFLLTLAALQGRYVRHLRESEAFYRWILAAATNEQLGGEKVGEEYRDDDLFADVVQATAACLPNPEEREPATPQTASISKLGQLAADGAHDRDIWNLARGPVLAQAREDFITGLRERKLYYAKGIEYAEAEAGGVNIFNLLLGFRRVAANFVWIQVDRYWHMGMMYRMIPLMKTCVTLDPNFVDAYLVGAWHLSYNATAKMLDTPQPLREWHPKYEACLGEKELYYYLGIDFLKDGIRNNPRNYKLYFDLGFAIYKMKLKDYGNAVRYISMAVRQPHDRWVPRQLYICQELNGQYAEAYAGWKDYMGRFPESQTATEVAPRFLKRNQGLIYEERWEHALEAVKAAANPAEKRAHLEEAERYKQSALDIWNSMDEPYSEYRKARINAYVLVNQGRFLEAVATLDKARWESLSNFDEISELIIDIKQQGGLPLSVSEKKAVLRRQEGGGWCPGKPGEPGEIGQ